MHLIQYAYAVRSEKPHQPVLRIAPTVVCGFYGECGDHMVSQANFFRDDISGELFPTPAEALESERATQKQRDGLLCMAIRHVNAVQEG